MPVKPAFELAEDNSEKHFAKSLFVLNSMHKCDAGKVYGNHAK